MAKNWKKEILEKEALLEYAIEYGLTRRLTYKGNADLHLNLFSLRDVMDFAEWYSKEKDKEVKEIDKIFKK